MTNEMNLSHERLIGRYVITWGRLELLVHTVLWKLLFLEPANGRLITFRLNLIGLLSIIRTIAKAQISEMFYSNLHNALLEIENLNPDRTTIIHGYWAKDMNGDACSTSVKRTNDFSDNVIVEAFPQRKFYESIKKIDSLQTTLKVFLIELDALRETPNQPPPTG